MVKMKYKMNKKVKVTAKVLVRKEGGGHATKNLKNEAGIIVKIDNKLGQYYVKTKYGVQLIAEKYLK